tara:strand:+ start:154 stop:834 length:681 start_codon:yes stop_codon:yes gene_type:complete
MRGQVLIDDRPVTKPGSAVKDDAIVRLKIGSAPKQYVSRGGGKLQSALDALELNVSKLRCVDVGASTGGFTDCLLQAGANEVVAVDVGYGLLAQRLRQDERVTLLERTNARHLTADLLPYLSELTVVDASFIGAASLLPALSAIAQSPGKLLIMVKPQFELPKSEVPQGGVVVDVQARSRAKESVSTAAQSLGWRELASVDSAVAGPKGNIETFILFERDEEPSKP